MNITTVRELSKFVCGNLIKPNFESQHAIVLEVGGMIGEHYASYSLRNTTQDFSQMVSHPFIN